MEEKTNMDQFIFKWMQQNGDGRLHSSASVLKKLLQPNWELFFQTTSYYVLLIHEDLKKEILKNTHLIYIIYIILHHAENAKKKY